VKKRKFRIGGKHDVEHHDDHAEHTWHDHHPAALFKRLREFIRRRMSSDSGVEDISTHAPIAITNRVRVKGGEGWRI